MRYMLLIALCFVSAPTVAETARTDWMERVTDGDRHCAFTDLVYWRDAYYLCFREGTAHNSFDGAIRVLRSEDARSWSDVTTIDTLGDDRDPHFEIIRGAEDVETLLLYFGVWSLVHGEGVEPPERRSVRSHAVTTEDGDAWSDVVAIYDPGWWVWRVRQLQDGVYGAAYTAVRPTPATRELRFLRSRDGLTWEHIGVVSNEFGVSESDFWREADNTLSFVVRTEDNARLFRSHPILGFGESRDLGVRAHAPVVSRWGSRTFLVGRAQDADGTATKLWEVIGDAAHELLRLPSGGDTSYAGLIPDPSAERNGPPTFLMSWYSQHETSGQAAAVYVARVVIDSKESPD